MSNFIPAVIRKQENVIENVIVLYHEMQKNTTELQHNRNLQFFFDTKMCGS
jgi:hypothetical protein